MAIGNVTNNSFQLQTGKEGKKSKVGQIAGAVAGALYGGTSAFKAIKAVDSLNEVDKQEIKSFFSSLSSSLEEFWPELKQTLNLDDLLKKTKCLVKGGMIGYALVITILAFGVGKIVDKIIDKVKAKKSDSSKEETKPVNDETKTPKEETTSIQNLPQQEFPKNVVPIIPTVKHPSVFEDISKSV